VLDVLERVQPVAGAPVLAVEVLTRDEFATRVGIVPSPTTLRVPAAAELMGITR
jgi:hypothetical protein